LDEIQKIEDKDENILIYWNDARENKEEYNNIRLIPAPQMLLGKAQNLGD